MKLATFCLADDPQDRLGLVDNAHGIITDIAAADSALNGSAKPFTASMLDLIDAGWDGLDYIEALNRKADPQGNYQHILDDVILRAPLPNPRQIRCFSAYAGHYQRMLDVRLQARWGRWAVWLNRVLPLSRVPKNFGDSPKSYRANPACIAGTDTPLVLPAGARILDYEMELGMIIGRGGINIDGDDAMDHIFGYTVYNDVTARDVLAVELSSPSGGVPDKGKNFVGSHIIGPWIVTADEIEDPYCRAVTVTINGKQRAQGDTDGLTHSVADIISEASRGEPLLPGELIGTGATEFGTGLEVGMLPNPGDVIEIDIEGIGTITNVWQTD